MDRRQFSTYAISSVVATVLAGCKPKISNTTVTPAKVLPHADLAKMSAVEMVEAFRTKKLSPTEVTAAMFERISVSQSTVNAYSHLDEQAALSAAKASTARWMKGEPLSILDGVPAGIKDQYQVAGMPQRFGSRLRSADPIPGSDSEIIARLRKAGVIMLGKTTQPEEGSISCSVSGLSGVTRNPHNLNRTVGGSSSGSGAAAAADLGPIQMAADGGGSIREPATYCGVFGFKPTPGVIPRQDTDGYAVYGPICRSLADIRATMTFSNTDFTTLPAYDAKALRIAYMPAFGDGLPPRADVLAATDAAVERLRSAGFKIETIGKILPYGVLKDIAFGFYYEDAVAAIEAYGLERIKTHTSPVYARFVETTAQQNAEELGKVAEQAFATLDEALIQHPSLHFDVVLMPGLPVTAFEAARAYPSEAETTPDYNVWMQRYGVSQEHSICLAVGSYLKLPEIAMPCGKGADGLPVGMIASARSGADARVLAFAEAVADLVAGAV